MIKIKAKICFVELEDKRITKAMKILSEDKTIELIAVGKEKESSKNLNNKSIRTYYSSKDPLHTGAELLRDGLVDGLIAGAQYSSKELIKAGLNIIGVKKDFASSYFLMKKGNKKMLFSDCGFNINPDAKQLSKIALQTIESALSLGIKPEVAFISYSTKGSAEGESVSKIRKAISLVKTNLKRNKIEVPVDGELQIDSAINPKVAKEKCPESIIGGKANVLIFPDLNSGNSGYKLLKELGGWEAIGPILQGFKRPIHDLSRGCNVEEIIDSVKIMKLEIKSSKK